MKVGDLVQDKKYGDLAVIIGEKEDQLTVYYMRASRTGDCLDPTIRDEYISPLKHCFKVISSAKGT